MDKKVTICIDCVGCPNTHYEKDFQECQYFKSEFMYKLRLKALRGDICKILGSNGSSGIIYPRWLVERADLFPEWNVSTYEKAESVLWDMVRLIDVDRQGGGFVF